MKKLSLLTINPSVARDGNLIKALKIFFLAFIFVGSGYSAYAQVVVTPASGGTVICGTSPSCTTLGNIKITEVTSSGDFLVGADQLVLNPPAGWQFCTVISPTFSLTPVPGGGVGDIPALPTIPVGGFTAGSLTINFNVTGTFRLDEIVIIGLQVQPITPIAAPGYIFAASEVGINGIVTGAAGTDFGDLRVAAATSAVYTVTGGGTYCPPAGLGVVVGLSGSDLGMSYQLFRGATLVATLPGTGGALNFGFQNTAGTYTVQATNGPACGYTAPMAGSAVITASASTITAIVGVPGPGINNLCAYIDSEQVHDATTGGIWNSDLVTVDGAGLPAGTVEVQAFAAGIATITYSVGGCQTVTQLTVNPLPAPILGPDSVCVGSIDTLTDALPGGSWASSTLGVATIGLYSGIVSGVAPGTTTITYTSPFGCDITRTITVNPLPSPITGTLIVCAGQTTILTSGPSGGTWTNANTLVATIFPTGGGPTTSNVIVTGIAPGSATIVYTLGTGCATLTSVTVDPVPAPITGSFIVCAGSNDTLGETTTGGNWTISNPILATVDATGVVYASTAGVDTVFYTLPAGNCGVSFVVTINPLPAPIVGDSAVCQGFSTILTDASTGGIWSSSFPDVAFIDVTGDVTGISPGTSTITWTLSTGCSTSLTVTVNSLPSPILSTVDSICADGPPFSVIDATAGGIWTLNDSTLVTSISITPDGDTANIVPALPGTLVVHYTLSTGCFASRSIIIDPVPAAPTAASPTVCQGLTDSFFDATPGGFWTSSNTADATIDSFTGVATGISSGSITITYTGAGGCFNIYNPFTINLRDPITGPDSVICQGNTLILSDDIIEPGSTWSSSNTLVAVVIASDLSAHTGTILGFGPGTATITYTTAHGCESFFQVTVNPITDIVGPSVPQMCVNDSFVLFDGTTGGIWTTSDSTIAAVSAVGEVHGIAAGTATISYTVPTGCFRTFDVTVNPIPGPINGIDSVCQFSTTFLSDSIAGGVWGSSNSLIATVLVGAGPSTSVLGLVQGVATITYEFAATGCNATVDVTVDPVSNIYGTDSTVCMLDSIQLNDSTGTGTWSSSNSDVATVSGTGIVTGVSAGTAIITYVTNIGGCPSVFQITVNPLPSPITGIDSVCVNNITHLFDTSAGGAGSWTSSTLSIATVGSTGIVTGVAAGTDIITYTLPVTGCQITTIVTVDPLPTGITGTDSSMCNGDSIVLHDITSGGVWASSNSSVATVNNTGGVKGLSPGTSIITYTLEVGACPASITVTVYPIPVISIVSAPNPPVICKGAVDTLAAFGADTGGVYAWTPSYGLSNTGIFDPLATPTITTTYEVIGTTVHGCRDSAFITVFVDSMLNHLHVTGTDSICNGVTDTIKASGEPEALFNWHTLGGLPTTIIGANPADTIVVRPSVTTTYEGIAIDAMGCKDSVQFKVTVNPIPQIKFNMNPVIVCKGIPKQIIVSTTNTDSNTTKFAWSPNILISCDTCDNPYLFDTFNLVYRVIATSIYGCYDSLNLKVSVLDTNVNTISNDTDICIGDSVRLIVTSNSVTSNLDVPTYYWIPSTGLNNPSIFDPVATPDTTTTYYVTIRENACFTVVDSVQVRVQPLPAITITPPSPIVIVAGTPTTLTATAPNVNAVRFLWVPGNSLNCDTCFDPIATPTANTTYTVTVTSFYGCVNTDTVSIKLLCDNSEIFIPNTFTPNGDGVNDRFFVSGKGISLITNFSVFNRWGECVFQAHNIPANNPGAGWDGTFKGYVLEPDVFIYVVDALCELGTSSFHYQGDVSIVK